MELFGRQGYQATTVAQIEAAAGLSAGAGGLYRHFRTKRGVLEEALRRKALAADFRFPMMDARLALGRVCALDGRYDEAMRWFAEAGTVLAEQGARPLRAITDLDASRVAARASDPRCARELRGAAEHAFSALGAPLAPRTGRRCRADHRESRR